MHSSTGRKEIVDRYADYPGDKLLPFESSERFNDNIKIIFEKAEVTYPVTELDTVTRTEKKVPINEIASSHMARRTFSRYRTIDVDMDMKMDLVKILEGAK